MSVPKLYMQQIMFDGATYTKGAVVDILSEWKVGVMRFPFMRYPGAKDVATLDWKGEDGIESYTPAGGLPLKDYDVDVTFLYSGNKSAISADLRGFIDYLYGRGSVGLVDGVGSGRFAIYDEHISDGRKDVRVVSVSNDLYWNEDCDDETIATFTVKFHVDDPSTDVVPIVDGGSVTDLTW